jgi:hypothetical protein
MNTVKIHFTVTGTTNYNKNGNYWSSRCRELKLTTYGNTNHESDIRMRKALKLWTDTLSSNGLLRERLIKLNIPFEIIDEEDLSVSKWTMDEIGAGV